MTIKENTLEGVVIVLLLAFMGMSIIMFSRVEHEIKSLKIEISDSTYRMEEAIEKASYPTPQELRQSIREQFGQ